MKKNKIYFLFSLFIIHQCISKRNNFTFWNKTYFHSGKVKDSCFCINSSSKIYKNGFCFEFYENGKMKNWFNFNFNLKEGKQIEYFDNGIISNIYFYSNNKLIDKHYSYYKNGCIKQIDTFINQNALLLVKNLDSNCKNNNLFLQKNFKDTIKINNNLFDFMIKDSVYYILKTTEDPKQFYKNFNDSFGKYKNTIKINLYSNLIIIFKKNKGTSFNELRYIFRYKEIKDIVKLESLLLEILSKDLLNSNVSNFMNDFYNLITDLKVFELNNSSITIYKFNPVTNRYFID